MTSSKGKLLGCIADEETCVGFLIAGIGEINVNKEPNYFIVHPNTPVSDIEDAFKKLVRRPDIDIIFITQVIAEKIRNTMAQHTQLIPVVMEIPSKDTAYDPDKDPIMLRAKTIFNLD